MDHGHRGEDMPSMAPPPGPGGAMNMSHNNNHHHMTTTTMHTAFFWGNKNMEVLFSGWPGTNTGMYYLSLIVVFLLAVGVEWISRSRITKKAGVGSDAVSAVTLAFMHAIRMGLAYLVMLAVMSFNVGVFIVAVAGHAFGFLMFGTRAVWKGNAEGDDN